MHSQCKSRRNGAAVEPPGAGEAPDVAVGDSHNLNANAASLHHI